jgi:AcrR family transcriptional regulator
MARTRAASPTGTQPGKTELGGRPRKGPASTSSTSTTNASGEQAVESDQPQAKTEASSTGVRRAEILATAAHVFAIKGYASSTVRDIGDESGILSGSLYYHFESKDQMLEEILGSVVDGLLVKYREIYDAHTDPVDALTRLIGVALHFVAEDHDGAMIMQNDFIYIRQSERFAHITQKYFEIREIWLAVLDQAVRQRLIRRDIDLAAAYRMTMGSILSTVRWFSPQGPQTIDAIAQQHASIFLNGILPRTS